MVCNLVYVSNTGRVLRFALVMYLLSSVPLYEYATG